MDQDPRRTKARGLLLLFALTSVLAVAGCTDSISSFDTITGRGDDIRWLLYLSFILSFAVMALVFGVLLYVLLRFRGAGASSKREKHKALEITWTAIPAALLVVLFIFSMRTALNVTGAFNDDDIVRIKVVGNQWWWSFEYPDLGFTTANELHVPADRPVRLEMTGKDVIHSFWVPEVGWKLDTIPGKTNVLSFETHREGIFDGACAEFCGVQHAWMRMKVVSMSGDDFDAWAKAQAAPPSEPASMLSQDGEKTFLTQTCASCHTVKGTSAKGTVGPDLTHFGSRATIGGGVVANTPENLEAWLRDPQAIKPGVLMPGFDMLSDEEIEALINYLEGLK